MTILTSYSSAADSLIGLPTSLPAAGQTLSYNPVTGLFDQLQTPGWSLAGNALTSSGDFIGTLNAENVVFKSNALETISLTPDGNINLAANTAYEKKIFFGALAVGEPSCDITINAQSSDETIPDQDGGKIKLVAGNSVGIGAGNIEFHVSGSTNSGTTTNESNKVLDLSSNNRHFLSFSPDKIGTFSMATSAANAGGQTLVVASGQSGAGVDLAGGNLNINAARGTGAGALSSVIFNGPQIGASGSVNQVTAPLATLAFNNANVAVFTLRGAASNTITAVGSAGLSLHSPAGTLNLGTVGNAGINIGLSTKTTNINGVVKRPNLGVLVANRSTTAQAIAANTLTTVIFNNNTGQNINQSSQPVTLDTATGVFTTVRTGIFEISGCLDIQSGTANSRGLISLLANTASITSTNAVAFRLFAANISFCFHFSFIANITVAGTFSIAINTPNAAQINFQNNTPASSASTFITIRELG